MNDIAVFPIAESRWPQLEELFGPNGACEGCWCMFWRLSGREYSRLRGEPARRMLRDLVKADPPPGLLAFRGGRPAGWCAVAPRANYGRILRSTTLRPADPDAPGVWAVPCFYVHRRHRRAGVAESLLAAAVSFVTEQGGRAVEGYPLNLGYRRYPAADLYTGTSALFARYGFHEVARPSAGRIIMRRDLDAC